MGPPTGTGKPKNRLTPEDKDVKENKYEKRVRGTEPKNRSGRDEHEREEQGCDLGKNARCFENELIDDHLLTTTRRAEGQVRALSLLHRGMPDHVESAPKNRSCLDEKPAEGLE